MHATDLSSRVSSCFGYCFITLHVLTHPLPLNRTNVLIIEEDLGFGKRAVAAGRTARRREAYASPEQTSIDTPPQVRLSPQPRPPPDRHSGGSQNPSPGSTARPASPQTPTRRPHYCHPRGSLEAPVLSLEGLEGRPRPGDLSPRTHSRRYVSATPRQRPMTPAGRRRPRPTTSPRAPARHPEALEGWPERRRRSRLSSRHT